MQDLKEIVERHLQEQDRLIDSLNDQIRSVKSVEAWQEFTLQQEDLLICLEMYRTSLQLLRDRIAQEDDQVSQQV